MTTLTRFLDWLCARLGLRLDFNDGNLCSPDGTEDWWPAAASCGTGKRTTTTAPNQPAAGPQSSDLLSMVGPMTEEQIAAVYAERARRIALGQVGPFHLPVAREAPFGPSSEFDFYLEQRER